MKLFNAHSRGFTLIEVMVSTAIFSVVMVMALGALLSLSVADRKAQSLKSAVDNLNFAIESMSRTIRTGYNYNCNTVSGGDCSAGSNTFYFTNTNGVVVGYTLSADAALCGQTAPNVGCLVRKVGAAGWAAITSPDVVIQNPSGASLFHVWGTATGSADKTQPIVVLTLSGYTQVSVTQQSTFHLQTVVTQRIYDQ